jgi:hypothetical protein
MPLYTLCSQCTAVPVATLGDLCEECERRNRRNRSRQDAWVARVYRWLTQKPSRRSHERKAGMK